MALKASGIGVGDEVIVPGLSFIATANAVILTGAKPVFADISDHDCNILTEEIQKLINEHTKAIIPVHINGRSADMETIDAIERLHSGV